MNAGPGISKIKEFRRWGCGLLCWALLSTVSTAVAGETVFLDEHFDSLAQWRHQPFAKILRHSSYQAVRCDDSPCLQMESDNSASALVLNQQFNVYQYPQIELAVEGQQCLQ